MEALGTSPEKSPPPSFEKALDSLLTASKVRPNLDLIVIGAKESLELIKSWVQIQCNDPVVLVSIDGVRKQSGPYVNAINQSVIAAVQGCTFSTDAIGFCDSLLDPETTKAEVEEYASEMRKTASEATKAATEASNLFRDIRKALFEIAREMDKAAAGTGSQGSGIKRWTQLLLVAFHSQSKSINPEQAFKSLERLTSNVDGFANWWTNMETVLDVLKKRAEAGRSRPRVKDLKNGWEHVRDDYMTYKCKIYTLHDQTGTIELSA